MKLLIVDDSPVIRKMLKNICKEMFDDIIECNDGDEAVQMFSEHHPDWTVMDIKMNKMDGLTATKKIMNDNPQANIIMISQFKDDYTIEASIKSGAKMFVSKEDLLKIREIIV